jgi:Sulfotransferase family
MTMLIHIGYPKAASTWLQNIVFSDEKSGFFAPWGLPSGEATEQFVIANAFKFSAETARQTFAPGLAEAKRRNLVPAISQETLIGSQIRGCYWGKEVADRLAATFPNAKILIVIREQKATILSSYREHIKMGETTTLDRFIGADDRKPGFGPPCQLDYLEYDRPIAYYHQLFGSKNVLVLPFELLKHNLQNFGQKILDFAGLDTQSNYSKTAENVGCKGATLELRRKLNFFCQGGDFSGNKPPITWRIAQKISAASDRLIPQSQHDRSEAKLKQFIAEVVGNFFQESNQKTGNLIGVNLAKIGYDC